MNGRTLEENIEQVRQYRRRLRQKGRAYHYWQVRGDAEPPPVEHWCEWCQGFYGVPHEIDQGPGVSTHTTGQLCRELGRYPGNRQCACIDCVVYENRRPR